MSDDTNPAGGQLVADAMWTTPELETILPGQFEAALGSQPCGNPTANNQDPQDCEC